MIRFINGEVDSPTAKRGCELLSSSMTDRPARRAIIASSEPENPEPIMTMSKSLFIFQNETRMLIWTSQPGVAASVTAPNCGVFTKRLGVPKFL